MIVGAQGRTMAGDAAAAKLVELRHTWHLGNMNHSGDAMLRRVAPDTAGRIGPRPGGVV